jgi:predicted transcriptional regulator
MFELPTGDDLKKLRQKLELTQSELARRAGVSQSLIARIEAGDIDPRLSTMRKILGVLRDAKVTRGLCAGDIMKSPVVHVTPRETIAHATRLMKENGISQLPVLENGVQIGSISEAGLVSEVTSEKDLAKISMKPVMEIMNDGFPTVSKSLGVTTVSRFVEANPAVLVVDMGKVVGIITKADIIKLMLKNKKKQLGIGEKVNLSNP